MAGLQRFGNSGVMDKNNGFLETLSCNGHF